MEVLRGRGVGDDLAADRDADVAGGLQDVDALKRVLGVHENRRVLLEPLVDAREVDLDEPVQGRGGSRQMIGKGDDVGGRLVADAEDEPAADRLARVRLEALVVRDRDPALPRAVLERRPRHVVLREEGMLPHESRLGRLHNVRAVEQELHHPRRRHHFHRALRAELNRELFQPGSLWSGRCLSSLLDEKAGTY